MQIRLAPSGPVLEGTVTGQTLVWDNTTKQWSAGGGQYVHDVVFNVPVINPGTGITITLTGVPDVAAGDAITVNSPTSLNNDIALGSVHENGANQVDVTLINVSAAPITPGNTTFRVGIMKP